MDLANLVSKSAPLLGSLIGSPIAGIGISWLAGMFGADPKDVKDVMDKINSDPEAEFKLRQLEMTHKEELLKIQSTDYQTEVDDRKSARDREKSLRDKVPAILAIGFMVIYASIQTYCAIYGQHANDIISARLQDVLIMIISYYFGSSHKDKPDK